MLKGSPSSHSSRNLKQVTHEKSRSFEFGVGVSESLSLRVSELNQNQAAVSVFESLGPGHIAKTSLYQHTYGHGQQGLKK